MPLSRLLLLVLVLSTMLMPSFASAAVRASFFGPIIPDGRSIGGEPTPNCRCEDVRGPDGTVVDTAPEWGCVLATAQNLVNFGVSIGIIVFVLVVVYAGILFMATPLNAENRELGRSIMLRAFIGMLIVLSAWLLVDFVMKTVYRGEEGAELGPWNSILQGNETSYCIVPRADPAPTSSGGAGGLTTTPGGGGGGEPVQAPVVTGQYSSCPNCVVASGFSRKPTGSSCNSGLGCNINGGCDPESSPALNPPAQSCMVNSTLLAGLQAASSAIGQVTEMWPPTINHSNNCHGNGTCVDLTPKSNSDSGILETARALIEQGLYPVWEANISSTECQRLLTYLQQNGVTQIQIDTRNTSPHFSVYMNPVSTGCR